MSITAKCLAKAQMLIDTASTLYTVTSGNTIIDKFTATNLDSGSQTLTVYLVPSGGSAGDTNTIIKEKSLTTKQTYDFTELQNQILNSGDAIVALASATDSIVVRVSGREVT